MNKIIVQTKDFDVSTEISQARENDPGIGAIVSFVGTVRDIDNETIDKMTLDYYPGMTEKALEAIVTEANQRWTLGNTTIIHRVGDLLINEQIVLVITTSKHRKSAFESCEFIMDYLKTKAPFWKKEYTPTQSNWVSAHSKDTDDADRWNK